MSDEPTVEIGNTRFIPTPEGGRVDLRVPVDGTPQWREAYWEREEVSRFCSSRYGQRVEYAPVLRPRLRDGERLVRTDDGRMFIETT